MATSSFREVPTISSFWWRSTRARPGAATDRISTPSTMMSASALSTSPTAAPAGRMVPGSSPLGSFAPALRQVQVPSGRVLVSSISSLEDIGDQLTTTSTPPPHSAGSCWNRPGSTQADLTVQVAHTAAPIRLRREPRSHAGAGSPRPRKVRDAGRSRHARPDLPSGRTALPAPEAAPAKTPEGQQRQPPG